MDNQVRPSPVSATVDFGVDGVQHGFLRLPYSRDDAAWGSVMIPVTVVKNGEGPTALLTGANHGDEYEGPIALFELARSVRPEDVTGRVIIVPAMNQPAFAELLRRRGASRQRVRRDASDGNRDSGRQERRLIRPIDRDRARSRRGGCA